MGAGQCPAGSPFEPGEVLITTTFNPTTLSSESLIPLSITIGPGEYALVFGLGLFGATIPGIPLPYCNGGMPTNDSDIPGQAPYFFWNGNPEDVGFGWNNGGFSNARFFVLGNTIP